MDKAKNAAIARRSFATITDVKKTFSTEHGKRCLYSLMRLGHMMSNSFHADPYEHAYNAGKREVVLWIMTQMKKDIKQLDKLIEEAENDDTASYEF
jgi:hypothetical protein